MPFLLSGSPNDVKDGSLRIKEGTSSVIDMTPLRYGLKKTPAGLTRNGKIFTQSHESNPTMISHGINNQKTVEFILSHPDVDLSSLEIGMASSIVQMDTSRYPIVGVQKHPSKTGNVLDSVEIYFMVATQQYDTGLTLTEETSLVKSSNIIVLRMILTKENAKITRIFSVMYDNTTDTIVQETTTE